MAFHNYSVAGADMKNTTNIFYTIMGKYVYCGNYVFSWTCDLYWYAEKAENRHFLSDCPLDRRSEIADIGFKNSDLLHSEQSRCV